MKPRGIYKWWPDTKRENLPTLKFRAFKYRKEHIIKCRSQREFNTLRSFLEEIGFVTI